MTLPNELSGKLSSIAHHFVQCCTCCQDESRNRCSRLLNDILLSGCEDDESRSMSYLWFFGELSKTQSSDRSPDSPDSPDCSESILHLRGILRDVMKLRRLLRCLLEEGKRKSSFDVLKLNEVFMKSWYRMRR